MRIRRNDEITIVYGYEERTAAQDLINYHRATGYKVQQIEEPAWGSSADPEQKAFVILAIKKVIETGAGEVPY